MNTPTSNTSSALAVSIDQPFWSAQQLAALKQIGVENAPNPDLAVFLNYAQRTGLDPFARQIYMIGRNQKTQNGWTTKWTIQASIDGLRIVAERSGDYAGQVGPEFCGADGVWRDVWIGSEPPVACRVGVLRQGFQAPLYAVAYWDEYVQTKDGKPTSMWATKPKLMLAKCAEALALRKAFPNDLAGLYTADEMGHPEARQAVAPAPSTTTSTWQPSADDDVVIADEVTGEVVTETAPVLASAAQVKFIQTLFTKAGYTSDDARHAVVCDLINRTIEHFNELTKTEAMLVIDNLKEQTL